MKTTTILEAWYNSSFCHMVEIGKVDQRERLYQRLLARLEAGDRAREALDDVEWVFNERDGIVCPWCDGNKHHRGHKPDCPRQLALGISNVTE